MNLSHLTEKSKKSYLQSAITAEDPAGLQVAVWNSWESNSSRCRWR